MTKARLCTRSVFDCARPLQAGTYRNDAHGATSFNCESSTEVQCPAAGFANVPMALRTANGPGHAHGAGDATVEGDGVHPWAPNVAQESTRASIAYAGCPGGCSRVCADTHAREGEGSSSAALRVMVRSGVRSMRLSIWKGRIQEAWIRKSRREVEIRAQSDIFGLCKEV